MQQITNHARIRSAANPARGDDPVGAATIRIAPRPAAPASRPATAGRQSLAWRRATRNPRIAMVLTLVAARARIDPVLMVHNSRCRAEVAAARQLAMYLMNVILSLTYTEVGLAFGRDRTTVRHACALIEDRREDIEFDSEVEELASRISRRDEEAAHVAP